MRHVERHLLTQFRESGRAFGSFAFESGNFKRAIDGFCEDVAINPTEEHDVGTAGRNSLCADQCHGLAFAEGLDGRSVFPSAGLWIINQAVGVRKSLFGVRGRPVASHEIEAGTC